MHDAPFRRLRLRTLRALAIAGVVFVLLSAVFVPLRLPMMVPWLEQASRAVVLAYGTMVLCFADESNAHRYGLGVAVASKLLTTIQGVGAPDMLMMLVAGANRIQPLLGAVFGDVTGSVVFGAWSVVDTVLIYLYRQGDAEDAAELRMVSFEVLYIAMSTIIASTLAHNFRTALTELAGVSAARTQFITNMNHELRTPIVGVVGMADGLLLEGRLPSPALDCIRVIRDSGVALLAQVNNILDFARLSAKVVRANPQPTNVRDMVAGTVSAFGAAATTKNLHMTVHVAPDAPTDLVVDSILVQHILSNLVGNAVKFTSAGSVSISVGCVPDGDTVVAESLLAPLPFEATASSSTAVDVGSMVTFRVPKPASEQRSSGWTGWTATLGRWRGHRASAPRVVQRGPALWIKVSDTGVGIAPERLAQILEPFQQSDNSITRGFGGSGLGLALCHDLVQLLHGEMVLASRPGVGSVFMVVLPCTMPVAAAPVLLEGTVPPAMPVAAPPTAPPPRPVQPVVAALGERRPCVLVVDDNPINVQVLRRQLHHLGCDTLVATNGAESVKLVETILGEQAREQVQPPAMRTRRRLAHPPSRRLDLILMDLHMPVMDGFEATREIRALERTGVPVSRPAMPIVTVSADDPATQRQRCEQAGMVGFLRKPVDLSELAAVLQHFIC